MVYSKENYKKNKERILFQRREYYQKHKASVRKRNDRWKNNNLKRYQEWRKIYFKKYHKAHLDYFKISGMKYYYKNKKKHKCRVLTYKILFGTKAIPYRNQLSKPPLINIPKKCKICGCLINLEIHHEIYPKNKEEILKAIKEKQIYFLCRNHHRLTSNLYNSSN